MSSTTPKGDSTDVYVPETNRDVCGNTQTGYDGEWLYKNLIIEGVRTPFPPCVLALAPTSLNLNLP